MGSDYTDDVLKSFTDNNLLKSLMLSMKMFMEETVPESGGLFECLWKQKQLLNLREQTVTHTEKLGFHLEGFISDNWMRGSNSYLKRTRLVAPSKKVTITISPNRACSPPATVDVRVSVLTAPFVWSSASTETSPELILTKTCFFLFFFLSIGSLLAAHSQYPLIKPVTFHWQSLWRNTPR